MESAYNTYWFQSLIFVIIAIIYTIVIFINARKMGYSGFLWLFVSLLYNPLATIYLLAALPNKKLDQRRKEEMLLLKRQLAQRGLVNKGESSAIPRQTISDERTTR